MSAHDAMNRQQFKLSHTPDEGLTGRHVIRAYDKSASAEPLTWADARGAAGYLSWHDAQGKEPDTIQHIEVAPGYQRQGIATAMFGHAKTITPGLHHATDPDDWTDEGHAWADAVDRRQL